MLSPLELLMIQQMKHRKIFLKILKETQNFESKDQVLRKSKSFSSYDSINANHRQISLTGTDDYSSKLYKVILFEKKLYISGIF